MRLAVDRIRAAEARARAEHLRERHLDTATSRRCQSRRGGCSGAFATATPPAHRRISLATRVPETLSRRLHAYCARRGVKVQRFVTDAIGEALHRRHRDSRRVTGSRLAPTGTIPAATAPKPPA